MPERNTLLACAILVLGIFSASSAAEQEFPASEAADLASVASASAFERSPGGSETVELPDLVATGPVALLLPIASESLAFASETASIFASAMPEPGKFLKLGLGEAVFSALERNRGLAVQRFDVSVVKTAIDEERAAFDPVVSGSISNSDRLGKQIMQTGALGDNVSNRTDGTIDVTRRSPSGTSTSLSLTGTRTRSARAPNLFGTRMGLDITHPLRRGAGTTVNMIAVNQAKLDFQASKHELEGFVLALVAEVEKKYWDLFLAMRELDIVLESHRLAVMQLEETNKKIALGSISESELAAAEAEVALREEGIIDAQSRLEASRIALLRIANPGSGSFWDFDLELTDVPDIQNPVIANVREHVETALEKRPELLQSKILLDKGELDCVQTKNGLVPRLDFFVTLGKSGYAETFEKSATELGMKAYDLAAGLEFELEPGRRAARMKNERARLSVERQKEALRNLRQLVQEEVLKAYLEVQRSQQQMKATAKTVEKQQEKLRVEQIKFSLGKTTAFQVAQAQRDVADSQTSQLRARIGYMNALNDLWRYDGTLCERLGITIDSEPRPAP
ncbi:MAG TPA: TolC family protein [Candidatus Ozemobacteraceae bacterium]|nr:TolC family protein [Candidatus Ozemobacteraceae bacterium]